MMEVVILKEHSKIMWKNIHRGDWDSVRKFLETKPGKRAVERTHFNGTTVLSFSVGYFPPVDVVMKMIGIHPNALSTVDVRGRLPLHVACASGASTGVIDALITRYPKAALVTDLDGRAPLHYAVASYCQDITPVEGRELPAGKPSFEAVTAVLAAAPDAGAIVDDVNCETPLDIACRMECQSVSSKCRAMLAINNFVEAEGVTSIRLGSSKSTRKRRFSFKRNRASFSRCCATITAA